MSVNEGTSLVKWHRNGYVITKALQALSDWVIKKSKDKGKPGCTRLGVRRKRKRPSNLAVKLREPNASYTPAQNRDKARRCVG